MQNFTPQIYLPENNTKAFVSFGHKFQYYYQELEIHGP